jgi:hypothetical protein
MLILTLVAAVAAITLFAFAFWTVDTARRHGGEPGFEPTYRAYGA